MTSTLAQAFPAGQFLAQELDARGWTQADFAEILGRPVQFVSEIVGSKKEITRESAAQIGAALGTSAQYWLNLQDSFYLWQQAQDDATQRGLAQVRRRARLNQLAPISALVKRGIMRGRTVEDQEAELRDLFELGDIDEEPAFLIAARRSNVADDITPTQLAWVACVRQRARQSSPRSYSRRKLERLAADLPAMVLTPSDFESLPRAFAEVGVRLVYVEQLPSSKIDGCSFLLDNEGPVIGLSGRGKRLDKVLFTLLHEMAHLCLGHIQQGDLIVEAIETDATDTSREEQANTQAAAWIMPTGPSVIPDRITSSWIHSRSVELSVAPIVLIGHLQNRGVLPWRSVLVADAPTVTDQLERWS